MDQKLKNRKRLVMVVLILTIFIVAIAGYVAYPQTVQVYALNMTTKSINVTTLIDGNTVINSQVHVGMSGIVGYVNKPTQLNIGSHILKAINRDFNLTVIQNFSIYGERYILVHFMADKISIEVKDQQPSFA